MKNKWRDMEKGSAKVAAEIIVFAALAIVSTVAISRVFSYRDTGGGGFDNFYSMKEDSIDLMIFGSSHAHCTVDNTVLWEDRGIASFTLSSGAQPSEGLYYYIREALKTQSPRVIIAETMSLNSEPAREDGAWGVDIGNLYRNDLNMRWSPLYAEMVFEQAGSYGLDESIRNGLLFKLPVIHGRYRELDEGDFKLAEPYILGYRGDGSVGHVVPTGPTEARQPLSERCERDLMRVIGLCRDRDISLILLHAPYDVTEREFAEQNSIADIADREGVPYYDINRYIDECGLDFDADFRDDCNHLNDSGAAKVTMWLEEKLPDHELPDHRGDEAYILWDKARRYQMDRGDKKRLDGTADLNDYLGALSDLADKYEVIVCLSGNYNALGDDAYAPALEGLGIDRSLYDKGGATVISRGSLVWSSPDETVYRTSGSFGSSEVTIARVDSDPAIYDERNRSDHIYIGLENYAEVANGVNIVIYDSEIDLVVDSIGVNVYDGLGIIRH